MSDWFMQAGHDVRFEWGPVGARRLASGTACLVVVDVLSFTTAVSVAVESGTRVFPYAWRDETASGSAEQVDASGPNSRGRRGRSIASGKCEDRSGERRSSDTGTRSST